MTELEDLNEAVRDLIESVRTLDAPADAISDAADQVRAVVDRLAPYGHDGPYMQAALRMQDGRQQGLTGKQPHEFFPYSPVVGPLNPIAPPVRLWTDGDRMRGEAVFRAPYNGPPSMVHGGVIALVFDELLGALNVVHGLGAFTGTLSVRYERPTPLSESIAMEAWLDRVEGRKVFTVGELRHAGAVTARAEGIFIRSDLLDAPPAGGGGT